MSYTEAVEKYKCGSCKYFRFEGKDETGKCSKFGHYYDPYDHCNKYWELAPDVTSRWERPVQK